MRRRGTLSARPGLAVAAVSAAVLLALWDPTPAAGQERFRRTPPLPDPRPLELKLPAVERSVLPNGLTVAVAVRPDAPLVTLQLVIRAGEADSPAGRPGVAAATARLIGKGTKMLSAEYIESSIESIGAELSVTVLMDYTVLTLHVLGDHLDRAYYLLRLIALEASFTERELGAVRRNLYWELFGRKRDPEVLAWGQLLRLLFAGHPYATATYSEEVIKFITTRDVTAFYDRFYRPGNAAVIVSGRVDADMVRQRLEGHFGAWSGAAPDRPAVAPPAGNGGERICFVEAPDVAEATIFAGNVIMNSFDPEFYPFLVLKQILGGTTRSRLFMNLRESRGYAYYAFSETEFFRSCGVYWARALVRPESIAPAVQEILREIGSMAAAPASPSEIEEAKSFLIGNLPLRFETTSGFAEWLARYVALSLDDGQWDRGPERFQRVDGERVWETARKYLARRPLVVIVGRPEWLALYLSAFAAVEVYDASGTLKYTASKGAGS